MRLQGILIVLFIFGIAAVMSGISVWHHYEKGRRCLEFWGPQDAHLINQASKVELLVLAEKTEPTVPNGAHAEDGQTLDIAAGKPKQVPIARRIDISQARGLVHARHIFVSDESFQWPGPDDATITAPPATWRYAVRFQEGEQSVALLLDLLQRKVRSTTKAEELRFVPKLSDGLEVFFAEQIQSETNPKR